MKKLSLNSPQFRRVERFLMEVDFSGFTSDDLFIMQFIKKGWGQDIAALSHMAEALSSILMSNPDCKVELKALLKSCVLKALHPSVSPYDKDIGRVTSLGKYGYYLEHLNIVLGSYHRAGDSSFQSLNERVTLHLLKISMAQENYHAPLLPHVKMRWSADQAGIIYSIWLFDLNNSTNLCDTLRDNWLNYMAEKMIHADTGLFMTEVMGTQRYSQQPRGCALAYLLNYMSRFAPDEAEKQWGLFKKHMLVSRFGFSGFREYLPSYSGRWTPDSGPIIGGIGLAASGLALNTASSIGDENVFKSLKREVGAGMWLCRQIERIPKVGKFARVGTDLLASAIYLNAVTKTQELGRPGLAL